jgi:hypothetical protein
MKKLIVILPIFVSYACMSMTIYEYDSVIKKRIDEDLKFRILKYNLPDVKSVFRFDKLVSLLTDTNFKIDYTTENVTANNDVNNDYVLINFKINGFFYRDKNGLRYQEFLFGPANCGLNCLSLYNSGLLLVRKKDWTIHFISDYFLSEYINLKDIFNSFSYEKYVKVKYFFHEPRDIKINKKYISFFSTLKNCRIKIDINSIN